MQEIIRELFTEEELNIFDEERISLSLKKVIGDLENRKINFYSLGNDQLYREILPRYFKWQGYGYLGNSSLHILKDYMLKDRDLADTSLAILLLDTGIIDGIPVTEKNPLESERVIKYKRSKGLKEKITISYDVLDRFPFYIKEVQCGHKNIITVEVDNEGSRKKVTLDIDIPANDHVTYNFTESLIIYTDFEIKAIDFSIICDTALPSTATKSIDDFDSFLKLVKINRKSARSIFSNEDGFKAFLEQSGDIEQILNYEDCKEISKEIEAYPFSLFCDINEIDKERIFKEVFKFKDVLNLQPNKNENKETSKEKVEKKVEEKVPNLENKLSDKEIKKEKSENLVKAHTEVNKAIEKNQPNINTYKKKQIIKDEKIQDVKVSEPKDNAIENIKKPLIASKKDDNPKGESIENKEKNIIKGEKPLKVIPSVKNEEDSKTISLEYTGKVENRQEDNIKYNKELIAKAKNNDDARNNVLDYNKIRNKKEEKLDNVKVEKDTVVKNHIDKQELKKQPIKEKEILNKESINKENTNNETKIKKIDNKNLENKESDEFKVQELQRDSKYKITRKDNKEESKKDMNIIDKIKQMLKGFKRS